MNLKNIFKEDITRPIEGVIKADDSDHLLQEVKEYVFTKEVKRKFARNFIEFYNNYEGVNGVWISGFFGSGKSHLLKMLSLLLENPKLEGKTVSDYFIPKVEDEILVAEIQKAVRIPSKSILFNIDQKADIISKEQDDAVLSVFVKVFNEMQGYYPKLGHIAEFERDLDNEGLYEQFKAAFKEISGRDWEQRRKRLKMATKSFAKALARVKGILETEAGDMMKHYRQDYKVSIEYFANLVKEYLDKQPPGFRLNFFVDEVGQYISDNTKLMTNLQTIAESLATKCKGQAWVFVTSQEDMDAVIGGLKEKQTNDFSKIQARFACKINLTSGNVGEVIQKRLLDKNQGGEEYLYPIYQKEQHNLPTLFRFGDGGTSYKGYKNVGDFLAKYPFLPYQFNLFQEAIRGLSVQNAFHGKHQSVGERSMLGVFQDVVKDMLRNEVPVGNVAGFDRMYDGIQSTLRGEIQSAVKRAEDNLEPFQQRVLKALFLVKYVKTFRPTVSHISILLIENFNVNLQKHEKRVQTALNNLEYEIYIQRNGLLYEFLTNEEKDIENEIKREKVDEDKVQELLVEIVYKNILTDTKIRFQENKQDYSFTRKLDDAPIGRSYELSLNVISPNHQYYDQEHLLKAHYMGKPELLVVLPEDQMLMQDLLMYLKVSNYFRRNSSITLKPEIRQILDRKKTSNNQLRNNLKNRMDQALAEATIYRDGQIVKLNISNPRNRIAAAFQQLISYAYPNLSMLKSIYQEEHIKDILLNTDDDLFRFSDESMSEGEREVLLEIRRNAKRGERSTVHQLLQAFGKRPYGWYEAAILGCIAQLFRRNKIDARHAGELLKAKELLTNLSNNRKYDYTIIEPLPEIDNRKLKALKDLHRELFNEANGGKEPKEVGLIFQKKLQEELSEIQQLYSQRHSYPFMSCLRDFEQQVRRLSNKNYHYYFEKMRIFEDDLLDFKEETLDPIKNFMRAGQKSIYDEIALTMRSHSANFNYVAGKDLEFLQTIKEHPHPFKGNTMQRAKDSLDAFKQLMKEVLEKEKKKATEKLESLLQKITDFPEFERLLPVQRERLSDYFHKAIKTVQKGRFIANIRDRVRQFEDEDYEQHFDAMMQMAQPKPQPVPKPVAKPDKEVTTNTQQPPTTTNDYPTNTPPPVVNEPRLEYVNKRTIRVPFKKPYLRTEEDVEAYIFALRKEYMEVIKGNRGISL